MAPDEAENGIFYFLLTMPEFVASFKKFWQLGLSNIKRRNNMLEVTDAAYDKIAEFFKDKEAKPIRVLLNPGG